MFKIFYAAGFYSLLLCLTSCGNNLNPTIEDIRETPENFYTHGKCQCDIGELECTSDILSAYEIPEITFPENQGPLGTCVSFATSACAEYIYGCKFSEAEFTVLAQTRKSTAPCEGGLFLGKALKLAQKYGLVEKKRFPYSTYLRKVALFNGINPSTTPNWKQQLQGRHGLQLCRVVEDGPTKAYNDTMRRFGVDMQLAGDIDEDETEYQLGKLQVIRHIPNHAIEENLQSIVDYNGTGLTRDFRRLHVSSPVIYVSASSFGYNREATKSVALTQRQPRINSSYTQGVRSNPVTRRNSSRPAYVGGANQDITASIELALAFNYPILMAIKVYEGCWDNPNRQNGFKIIMPDLNNLPHLRGSHAVMIMGYNRNTELFTIKNSWGADWGEKGFAYIPYRYVQLFAREIIAIKQTPGEFVEA